jgi:phosphatidate phosphatase APP1
MLLPTPLVTLLALALPFLDRANNKFRGYFSGNIARDEEVLLFPTLAHALNATHWNVPIHGWIYEPEMDSTKRKAFLKVLRKVLQISKEEARNTVLQRRVQPFLVDNERWKSPVVNILGNEYRPPRSLKNGHFQGNVVVAESGLMRHGNKEGNRLLPLSVTSKDGRVFSAHAHLIPTTGISVISDIDDTIKISNVGDTKQLLKSSFLEEFQPVPGMAELYRRLQSSLNATFHFVSSSPYQFYNELESFRQECQFPPATYHLKTIRPKDKSLLALFADPVVTKTTAMESIMEKYPQRKYILIGDSEEKDPEVYGAMARKYPDRIVAIWIRNVGWKPKQTKKSANDDSKNAIGPSIAIPPKQLLQDRLRKAFDEVPTNKWLLFEDPCELQSFSLDGTP